MKDTPNQAKLRPPLDEYDRQIVAVKEEGQQLLSGMSAVQLNWSPAPGRWSIGSCFEHLTETVTLYNERLAPAIAQAREQSLVGDTGKYNFFERFFISSLEPPPKRRFKAPSKVRPQARDFDPDKSLATFLRARDQLIELLHLGNGLDLARFKIVSPFSSLIRFRVGSVFAIIAAHDRRHLWQARQVTREAGFPAA